MSTIPHDYAERVYAGVLGKIIGVYIGRPFEGWPHERILTELGEITYYVHEKLDKPLIVPDDDISGTLAFLRAMPDYGNSLDLTPAQIGQTWLNYLIEERTVLWWGGMGNSTEHTAYLRLKAGIPAPDSGSIALNGQVVAEQIGAQIFIDGWGMISPGDPEQAADLARRAASVSHDGVAIHGAQVVAAIEAQAFVEPDIDALLDVGVSVIPADSLIRRLIDDVRDWRGKYESWYECYYRIAANYGYDKYGGNCHMVPNHALIIMALLYSDDRFSEALKVVNTAGWDTDCNSANVGCIMGIKNGLAGLDDGPDLREPVADRIYLPTADGGRTVTDALREAYAVINIGRALADEEPLRPKDGARYSFSMPGAVQGFMPDDAIESRGAAWVENVAGHSAFAGGRSLAIHLCAVAPGRPARIWRETYPAYQPTSGYRVLASPTLYPGQTLRARLSADEGNSAPVDARLCLRVYGADDALELIHGPAVELAPGAEQELAWKVEAPVGSPIAYVGIAFTAPKGVQRVDGVVYLDWLIWEGAPDVALDAPKHNGTRWVDAWVRACWEGGADRGAEHTYRLIQNEGMGLFMQGTREWRDYAVSASVTPHLARSFGIAARVQGLKRYYALLLTQDGKAQLVRELDGTHVLAEEPFSWELYHSYALELQVQGSTIRGLVDGEQVFEVDDDALGDGPDAGGAIALLIDEGRLGCKDVRVRPIG